jgi:phenylacetate-CoA ligase
MSDRAALEKIQSEKLRRLVDAIFARNPFYSNKFQQAGLAAADVQFVGDLWRLPFTTKDELAADQQAHPPYGTNLTYPLSAYVRLHQTSGTRGQPLRWLDTAESWQWAVGCWTKILGYLGVTEQDRLFFAFSFGPFLGFWTGFEAAAKRGCLCVPAGGMSSLARLRMLLDLRATVMLCTPTYGLHLAEVARENQLGIQGIVRAIIVAGEPGGNIPATRRRIEEAWGARVFDHSGMTEVGPMTFECPEHPGGLYLLEEDYIAEVIDPATLKPVPLGTPGELVVTNLGRLGSPVLRYRTGDLVRIDPAAPADGPVFLRLAGGILGRTDDMIPIRGNNLYPSALEEVLRRFSEIVEYRVEIDASASLTELRIEIEPAPGAASDLPERVAQALRDQLLFRAEVTAVPPGTLPRFEMKAQRIRKKT